MCGIFGGQDDSAKRAAEEQRQREAQRRARIDQGTLAIDEALAPFDDAFFDTRRQAYAYNKIRPLFQNKGEFLINFMFNHISRFVHDTRENTEASFERLFGLENWKEALHDVTDGLYFSEKKIVEFYCNRLRTISNKIKWAATYTPISHPEKGRSWFYLIYATTHVKGLKEFHKIEDKVLKEYGEIRKEVLHKKKVKSSEQTEMFDHSVETPKPLPLDTVKFESEIYGEERLMEIVQGKGSVSYGEIAFEILQIPLVNEKTLKHWLKSMKDKGVIEFVGLKPRQVPKDQTIIKYKAPSIRSVVK